MYPGIPNDYTDWPRFIKDAWIQNIPYALAEKVHLEKEVDPSSPSGRYVSTVLRTGDVEKAEQELLAYKVKQKQLMLNLHFAREQEEAQRENYRGH